MSHNILIGANLQGKQVYMSPSMGNRHGLIAGATGTGKTISLQILAEAFSKQGVAVFTADVKGDLSGLAQVAQSHEKVNERVKKISIDNYQPRSYPVRFWDIFGKTGHVVRTTIEDMGAELLSSLLELTDSQASILYIAFTYADDENLPLLDMKDLRELVAYFQENRKLLQKKYGSMSSQSLGALQRKLLVLEEKGGEQFFGEPMLNIHDFIQVEDGYGVINILDGRQLMTRPRVYTTFLMWFLMELFEQLEEQGDANKPKLVFFFDEAHLLFDNAPKILLERLEQVIRLIRSKGVGIYFVTQSPADIPDSILNQLGNRIQHALRAFTPKEKKAVKVAAQSFRENPGLDTKEAIMQLGIGEALVSVLDESGVPTIVEQTLVVPPQSQIGPISLSEQQLLVRSSPLNHYYERRLDRDSAYELLTKKREENKERIDKMNAEEKKIGTERRRGRSSRRQGYIETFAKSMLRSLASSLSRRFLKSLLRSLGR